MKAIVVFSFTVVLVALQAALLHFVGGGAFSVALALPCVVYLGLFAGNVYGSVGSAAVGYVLDVAAGGPKGLMTFLAVALFLFVRLVGVAVEIRGRAAFAVLSAVGCFVFGVGAMLLTRAVTPPEAAPSASLLPRMIVEALVTGAAAPIIHAVMRRIDALFTREEPGLLR